MCVCVCSRLFASGVLQGPQDGPKMAQESSKKGPRGPQDCPKSAEDRPKRYPRAPQEATSMTPEGVGKSTTLVKMNLRNVDRAPAMSARPSMPIDAPPMSGPRQKRSDRERLGSSMMTDIGGAAHTKIPRSHRYSGQCLPTNNLAT